MFIRASWLTPYVPLPPFPLAGRFVVCLLSGSCGGASIQWVAVHGEPCGSVEKKPYPMKILSNKVLMLNPHATVASCTSSQVDNGTF